MWMRMGPPPPFSYKALSLSSATPVKSLLSPPPLSLSSIEIESFSGIRINGDNGGIDRLGERFAESVH